MEGLSVVDANLTVYIHPSKANKIKQSILRQLSSSLLFQFNEDFEGVVLAYDVDIGSKHAKILPGINPYFGVKLKAKLLLFSPKPDMLLEGKVVKLGKESIHVVILGFSSAAITFEDIRKEFKHKIKHGEGVFSSRSHKKHVIRVGTMLRFLVKSFDEEILHISGSLNPANTGCIRWLYKHAAEEGSEMDRSTRKERKRAMEMETQEQILWVNDGSGQHKSAKKERKRARKMETQEQILQVDNGGALSSNRGKSHKSKRRKTVEES